MRTFLKQFYASPQVAQLVPTWRDLALTETQAGRLQSKKEPLICLRTNRNMYFGKLYFDN